MFLFALEYCMTIMNRVDLSLILPAYNEGSTFEASVDKILKELKNLSLSWEIIFVEDKSVDETKKTIQKLIVNNKNIRAIFHTKNTGRGKSVSDGIRAAKAPVCGYMDVDCEVSPTYINLFYKEIKKGSDLAVGKRFYEKNWKSALRYVASKVYSLGVKILLGLPIEDTEVGYKFFNTKTISRILPKVNDERWFWDTEICAMSVGNGLNVSEIPVLFIRRPEKKSTVKVFSDSLTYLKRLWEFRAKFRKLRNSNV